MTPTQNQNPDDARADAVVNPDPPADDAKDLARPGDRQSGGEPVDAAEEDPS